MLYSEIMTECLLHYIMFLYYIIFPITAVTVTACNNVQVSFTDRTVGSASNTGPTAETTSAESGSGENRSNQNATNKNESESLRPTEEVEDQEEDEETLVEATLDPVTSTPDSNRRPKVVYAGELSCC